MNKGFLFFVAFLSLLSCDNLKPTAGETLVKTTDTTQRKDTTPPASEFAEARYTGIGKERMKLFEAGEYDKWGEGLADNTVTYWSGGDSLVGKKAIVDYWKEQKEKHVDTLYTSNHIWLPLRVNRPQSLPDLPGVWVMYWSQWNAKYKNGRSLQFWIHQAFHYNSQDKIDRTVIYLDQAPVNAVLENQPAMRNGR